MQNQLLDNNIASQPPSTAENIIIYFQATLNVIASAMPVECIDKLLNNPTQCCRPDTTTPTHQPTNKRTAPWGDGAQQDAARVIGPCSLLLALPLACIFYPFTILCGCCCKDTSGSRDSSHNNQSSSEDEDDDHRAPPTHTTHAAVS